MTRKSRQFFGSAARWRAARVLAALTLAALGVSGVSGCLVTENRDFERTASTPRAIAITPPPLTRVRFVGSPECEDIMPGRKAMLFDVVIQDQDVAVSPLWTLLYVNGVRNGITEGVQDAVMVPSNGTTERAPARPLCVAQELLNQRCNLVEFVVSSNFFKVTMMVPFGPLDPEVGSVRWLVLPPADAQPDADDGDCASLFGDGGV